jgi:hypothetical protein
VVLVSADDLEVDVVTPGAGAHVRHLRHREERFDDAFHKARVHGEQDEREHVLAQGVGVRKRDDAQGLRGDHPPDAPSDGALRHAE